MFCPKCGKDMPDTAMFCGNCGHKFEKSEIRKQTGDKTKKFVKKFVIAVLGCCVCLSIALAVMLTRGCMLHDWQEATCTEPKICNKCGKTKGEALGHTWAEATCIEPQTCSKCGETEGEALGHDWINATCTEPQTCIRCHNTSGEIGEHSLDDTGKCSFCGNQVGVALNMSNYRQYLNVAFSLYRKGDAVDACGWRINVSPVDYNVSFKGVVIEYQIEIADEKNHRFRPYGNSNCILDVRESGIETDQLAFIDAWGHPVRLDLAEVVDISGFVLEKNNR